MGAGYRAFVIPKNFEFLGPLGEGGFGVVIAATETYTDENGE